MQEIEKKMRDELTEVNWYFIMIFLIFKKFNEILMEKYLAFFGTSSTYKSFSKLQQVPLKIN